MQDYIKQRVISYIKENNISVDYQQIDEITNAVVISIEDRLNETISDAVTFTVDDEE
jgi:hypothetical protein